MKCPTLSDEDRAIMHRRPQRAAHLAGYATDGVRADDGADFRVMLHREYHRRVNRRFTVKPIRWQELEASRLAKKWGES